MHAAAFNALRVAHRPLSRPACRVVAGCRSCLPCRVFHRSAVAYRIPDTGSISVPNDTENTPAEDPESVLDESKIDGEGTEAIENSAELDNAPLPTRKNGKTASGRARGNRPRQPEGLPPFILPESFLENNVRLAGEFVEGSLAVVNGKEVMTGPDSSEVENASEIGGQSATGLENGSKPADSRYGISRHILEELEATLRAGLALRPPKSSNPTPRPISVLQCPRDGGSYYLDAIVEKIAGNLGADLVRLGSQELAQLIGPYLDENIAWNFTSTSLLSYEAHRLAGKLEEHDREKEAQEEADEVEGEDDAFAGTPRPFSPSASSKRIMSAIFTGLQPNLFRSNCPKIYGPFSVSNPKGAFESPFYDANRESSQGKSTTPVMLQSDVWDNLKISTGEPYLYTICNFLHRGSEQGAFREPLRLFVLGT
jgi:hypothetical protein